MKRIITILALTAALWSCAKTESTSIPDGFSEFFVSMEQVSVPRVTLTPDASAKWSEGDSIGVFSNLCNPAVFRRQNSEGRFTGSPVKGDVFYGFYPYAKGTYSKSSPNLLTFDSPAPVFNTQSVRAPMIAVSEDNHLFFRQTCGMIHFFVRSGTDYDFFTFFGNKEEVIAGRGTVDLEAESPEFVIQSDERIVIGSAIPDGVSFSNGFHLYIILPPMTFEKGFSLVFYKLNSETGEMEEIVPVSTENPIEILRGQSVRMPDIDIESDHQTPHLEITKPEGRYKTDPHADLINLAELKISGTFNGIPLNIKYSTIYNWIILSGDGSFALIQGNTTKVPRSGYIMIQYCFGLIPIHQEFYHIDQSSFTYSLNVTSNKGDFPYWSSFDTEGKTVLFYTPYADSQSFILRSNARGMYYNLQAKTDIDTAEDAYMFADDPELPVPTFEETDNGGTGYDLNYKVTLSYSANRNYAEDLVSYDMDDICFRGLYRLCEVIFYPRIQCVDLETWSLYEDYQYDAYGNPEYQVIYLVQTPIIMYDYNDWWHFAWPMSDQTPDYEGYNPAVAIDYGEGGYLEQGDAIISNMDWRVSDIITDNSSWRTYFEEGDTYGIPNGGDVRVTEVFPYAAYYVKYTKEYRPSVSYPDRSTGVFVKIDMKDGKAPIFWPLANIYQPGIPVIQFTKFTWNGYWKDIYETDGIYTYTKQTRGYYYVSVSNVGKYEFQACCTDKHNDSYYWHDWEPMTINDKGYTRCIRTGGSLSFDGYEDFRMEYPNNTFVYAVNGPWHYSTSGAPIEPNPIPASAESAKRPDKSRRKTLEESLPKGLPALSKPVLTNGTPIK